MQMFASFTSLSSHFSSVFRQRAHKYEVESQYKGSRLSKFWKLSGQSASHCYILTVAEMGHKNLSISAVFSQGLPVAYTVHTHPLLTFPSDDTCMNVTFCYNEGSSTEITLKVVL